MLLILYLAQVYLIISLYERKLEARVPQSVMMVSTFNF